MKKELTTKQFILVQIACTAIIYLIIAFINSEINASYWGMFERILVPVLGFIFTMAIAIYSEPTR